MPTEGDPMRADAANSGQTLEMLGASLLKSLHEPDSHDATVEAIKEGDRVTKLIVTCRCGERIEILCAYAPR